MKLICLANIYVETTIAWPELVGDWLKENINCTRSSSQLGMMTGLRRYSEHLKLSWKKVSFIHPYLYRSTVEDRMTRIFLVQEF